MENTNDRSSPSPVSVIVQPKSSNIDSQSYKLIIRFGWSSVYFGFGAFILYHISGDRSAYFSTFNVGVISGLCFIIAGLASVAAGYKKTSYRCFIHAQIWSFLILIIVAPSLIAVSIVALIIGKHGIHPTCQPVISSSRMILFRTSTEIYPSNIPCLKVTHLFNLIKLLSATQLFIGVICFFAHVILIFIQRKIIRQMKMNDNDDGNAIITYTQPSIIDTNHPTCYADNPPKYEDLPPRETLAKQAI